MSAPELVFKIEVDNKIIPASQFNITGGAYGSVGHVDITTSLTALNDAKIDLFDITSNKPGFTEIDVSVQTTQSGPSQSNIAGTSAGGPGTGERTQTRIFGGEYLSTMWDMDTDLVHIKGRDWAGQLVDQKRVLTKIAKAIESVLRPLAPGRVTASGISGENQKIGDIVTSIANEFGFTPVLNLSDTKGNPSVGTLYGSADQAFLPLPQSLWNILNQIARDTGYVVYVTPKKELVFGEPGAGLETIQLSWNKSNIPSGYVPCKNLKLEHNPRRNSTFRVVVMSYDPHGAAPVVGRAIYVGGNFAGSKGLNAGISSGQDATSEDKALAKLDVSVKQVALYTFHVDGLSQEQADMRAATIATDIAKRDVTIAGSIDGLPAILPTQKLQIVGDVPDAFTPFTFYVSQYSQVFTLPDGRRSDAGWMTNFTALNTPEESQASTRGAGGSASGDRRSGAALPRQRATDIGNQTLFPNKVG